MKSVRHALSLHPLAASLALLFGAPAADAVPPHTAFVVQNCLDHGPGSLRQAVIDDTAGEPIDLTQLTCSSITLTTGGIVVETQLLIQGPGPAALTIDGAGLGRVFNQSSTQSLFLYGMTIRNGMTVRNDYTDISGGCIYSAGALHLKDTVVRNCRVSDTSVADIKGGGVFVRGALIATNSSIVDNEIYSTVGNVLGAGAVVEGLAALDHSTISGNVASSGVGGVNAGGIDVGGVLTMTYSTVSNNRASGHGPSGPGSYGGIWAHGGATISRSTISGNSTDGRIGGLYLGGSATAPRMIVDSTISGNWAASVSGVYARGSTSILNSTIAFNVESSSAFGAGLYLSFGVADLESTIIAANTSVGGSTQNIGPSDLDAEITGANNLIGPSLSVTLPPGTIGGDPKLLPLHDNGGPTKTHALRPDSPAVDAGNVTNGVSTDQRGSGFPRIIGASADIGAFEGVDADSIFYNGFD